VNPLGYVRAIKGAHPDPKGEFVIWGWGKIAQVTMDKPKYQAEFYQARLNQAQCHYSYGIKEKDQAGETSLNMAKQDIRSTYQLRPELGGNDTWQEFDRLLKKIQEALQEKPVGLEEFKKREAAKTAAG
jgi:hypothetical protein